MPELVAPIMPDIAGSFAPLARGMAQWAQNRRYAQQLELQYQKQAQDAAIQQQKFGLDREQLAAQMTHWNDSLDVQRAQLAQSKQQRDDDRAMREKEFQSLDKYRTGSLDLRDAIQDYKEGKDVSAMQEQTALTSDLASINSKFAPGTSAFKNATMQALGKHPGALRSTWGQKLLFETIGTHDTDFKTKQAIFDRELSDSGFPKNNLYDTLMNQDIWKSDPKKPDRLYTQIGVDAADKPVYVTAPTDKIKQWRNTYKDLYGSGQPSDQTLTPPTPTGGGQEVIRMTRDNRRAVFDAATKQFLRYAD